MAGLFINGWWITVGSSPVSAEVAGSVSQSKIVQLYGKIYKQEMKNEKLLIYVRVICESTSEKTTSKANVSNDITSNLNNLLIYLSEPQLFQTGNIVFIKGTLVYPRLPTNPGQFNAKSYYNTLRVDALMYDCELKLEQPAFAVYDEFLYNLKNQLSQSIYSIEDKEHAAILEAMVLGDKNEISSEIMKLYQESGISHILAISGLHITLIGMYLLKILRKSGGTFLITGVMVMGIIISYGIMTGMSVSTKRAVIMFILSVFAGIVGRTYDMLSALSLAGILILIENPYAMYSAGFLLSFVSILGIAILSPCLHKIIVSNKKIVNTLITSGSIQLATIPLTLYFFYEIPLYGIFLNLFVIPLMAIVVFSGLSGAIIGLKTVILGEMAMGPAHYILIIYQILCTLIKQLPMSVLAVGQPALWKIVLYYVGIVLFVIGITKRYNRKLMKAERTYYSAL